jgi:hypothetical protein
MAKTITPIDTANDTFQVWIDRFNELINFANTEVVTVNSSAGITTGNGFINGIFGANTLVATFLRGGNVSTSGLLTITSNVSIDSSYLSVGNTSTNTRIDFANITIANSTVDYSIPLPTSAQKSATNFFLSANGEWGFIDTTAASVAGSNTFIQFNDSGSFGGANNFTFNKATVTLGVGNSSINTSISTTQVRISNTIGNTVILPTSITIGNSSVFTIVNSTSVSAANGFFTNRVNTNISSIGNGSAASPSLTFTSDPDTGLYRSNENQMTVTLGGTNKVTFGPSNTVFSDRIFANGKIVALLTVSNSTSAPANPGQGELWFNTGAGKLFIYYNDGTSAQWISVA